MTERMTLVVKGMGCTGCEDTVASAVAKGCDQAREITADHKSGVVTFTCPSADNLPAVKAAIGAAGYPVAKG